MQRLRMRPILLALFFGTLTIMMLGFVKQDPARTIVDPAVRFDTRRVKNFTRSMKPTSIVASQEVEGGVRMTLKNTTKLDLTAIEIRAPGGSLIYELLDRPVKPGSTMDFLVGGVPGLIYQASDIKVVFAIFEGQIIDGDLEKGYGWLEKRRGELAEYRRYLRILDDAGKLAPSEVSSYIQQQVGYDSSLNRKILDGDYGQGVDTAKQWMRGNFEKREPGQMAMFLKILRPIIVEKIEARSKK